MIRRSKKPLPLWLLLGWMLFPTPSRAEDPFTDALRGLPPHQRAAYRRQLHQIERVAHRLREAIPNPPRVHFTLAAGEPSLNAGATSGKVFVTEGTVRFVRSDDELAAVLGHELAHLTEGHVSRGAMQNSLLSLGSLLLGAIHPGVGLAAGQVGKLFLNHFNQDQEREADRVGLYYAYKAGYDPWAAVEVMRRMAEEEPQTATAGFFSSHPSSLERARTLKQEDEEACHRARPYFYRAQDTQDVEEQIAPYRRGLRLCPQSPREPTLSWPRPMPAWETSFGPKPSFTRFYAMTQATPEPAAA